MAILMGLVIMAIISYFFVIWFQWLRVSPYIANDPSTNFASPCQSDIDITPP